MYVSFIYIWAVHMHMGSPYAYGLPYKYMCMGLDYIYVWTKNTLWDRTWIT